MSEGTDSTQTKTGKENLTLRARVCTKPLPCRRVWENEKYCRELAKDITSLIKWPTKGWWKHWFLIARIEVSESPSKIELPKLISWRKVTALRSTIVSKTTIDDGRGMISDNAARTIKRRSHLVKLKLLSKNQLIQISPYTQKTEEVQV